MELVNASQKKKAFQNLFNLYVHELSGYDHWLGTALDSEGIYQSPGGLEEYYDETKKEAYVIMEDEQAIGFVVFSQEPNLCSVNEIFIVNSKRNMGIASGIIQNYWKDKTGTFMTHLLKNNQPAISFWENLFKRNNYLFETTKRDEVAVNYWVKLTEISLNKRVISNDFD